MLADLVWSALPDVRTDDQRSADDVIERECRDEPDRLERLRQDAVAVCSEFFEAVRMLQNRPDPACPGCQAREYESRDLVAEQTVIVLTEAIRAKHRNRKALVRARAIEAQMRLAV